MTNKETQENKESNIEKRFLSFSSFFDINVLNTQKLRIKNSSTEKDINIASVKSAIDLCMVKASIHSIERRGFSGHQITRTNINNIDRNKRRKNNQANIPHIEILFLGFGACCHGTGD